MEVRVVKLDKEAQLPVYATDGSAGFDLYALEDCVVYPQDCVKVRTGLVIECPKGTALMLYPRSGISVNTTLRLANGVGVVDSDYRGEVLLPFYNMAARVPHQVYEYKLVSGERVTAYDKGCVPEGTVVIKKGDKIAQGIIHTIEPAVFKTGKQVSKTERGDGGFGSTGTK